MANPLRNRKVIIPPGILDTEEINVIEVPRALQNTSFPLLVTPARRGLRAQALPNFDDSLAQHGPTSRHSHLSGRGQICTVESRQEARREAREMRLAKLNSRMGDTGQPSGGPVASSTPRGGGPAATSTPRGGGPAATSTPRGGGPAATSTPRGGGPVATSTPRGGGPAATSTPRGGGPAATSTPRGGGPAATSTPRGGGPAATFTPERETFSFSGARGSTPKYASPDMYNLSGVSGGDYSTLDDTSPPSLMEDVSYSRVCEMSSPERPKIIHASSRTRTQVGDNKPETRQIEVNAPEGVDVNTLRRILEMSASSDQSSAEEGCEPVCSGPCSPNYRDEDEEACRSDCEGLCKGLEETYDVSSEFYTADSTFDYGPAYQTTPGRSPQRVTNATFAQSRSPQRPADGTFVQPGGRTPQRPADGTFTQPGGRTPQRPGNVTFDQSQMSQNASFVPGPGQYSPALATADENSIPCPSVSGNQSGLSPIRPLSPEFGPYVCGLPGERWELSSMYDSSLEMMENTQDMEMMADVMSGKYNVIKNMSDPWPCPALNRQWDSQTFQPGYASSFKSDRGEFTPSDVPSSIPDWRATPPSDYYPTESTDYYGSNYVTAASRTPDWQSSTRDETSEYMTAASSNLSSSGSSPSDWPCDYECSERTYSL